MHTYRYLGAIVATTSLVGEMGDMTFVDGIMLVLQLLASLVVVVIFATLASKYVLPRLILEINGQSFQLYIRTCLGTLLRYPLLIYFRGKKMEKRERLGQQWIKANLSTFAVK